MEFRGRVAKKPFGVGSKSERRAVVLETEGGTFVLRRRGGNAYSDPVLDALIGKTIHAEGDVHGHVLILRSWRTDSVRKKARPKTRRA